MAMKRHGKSFGLGKDEIHFVPKWNKVTSAIWENAAMNNFVQRNIARRNSGGLSQQIKLP
jgi:hypothetical protein